MTAEKAWGRLEVGGCLNEGGAPGFLVRGDLVWIWGDKTQRSQIQVHGRIFFSNYFYVDAHGNTHVLCTERSSLCPCQRVRDCVSVQGSVIKASQRHPEQRGCGQSTQSPPDIQAWCHVLAS